MKIVTTYKEMQNHADEIATRLRHKVYQVWFSTNINYKLYATSSDSYEAGYNLAECQDLIPHMNRYYLIVGANDE